MARKQRGPSPERAKTDDSLRRERRNTDAARKDDRASTERHADGVVDRARAIADDVLSAARLQADRRAQGTPRPAEGEAIAGERARADSVIRAERASADVVLRGVRAGQVDLLDRLLIHERAATDAYLSTERARSDDAVEHRDDFLGIVAHDIRNLLNLMVLSLELLPPGDEDTAAQVSEAVNRIRRYVARMNRLVGDLVDVTSIEAGKLAVTPSERDAAALVAEAAETFLPAAVDKGLSLSMEVPAHPVRAQFDHDRMLQVFANLLANAIKFTPRGGRIVAGVESERDQLRFYVSDTGVGIPSAMLEAIFERFWQVGENDRRGMGLGLYISKCIVGAHGGRIWAESVPGQGSRLSFTIPFRSAPGRAAAAGVPSGDRARKARPGGVTRRQRG